MRQGMQEYIITIQGKLLSFTNRFNYKFVTEVRIVEKKLLIKVTYKGNCLYYGVSSGFMVAITFNHGITFCVLIW